MTKCCLPQAWQANLKLFVDRRLICFFFLKNGLHLICYGLADILPGEHPW